MKAKHEKSSILLLEFGKFALFFMVLYYFVLFFGGQLLKLGFISSAAAIGQAGGQIIVSYLIGIQFIGLGFGWIGYGMAATFRENPQSPANLFLQFSSKGMLQRTPKPSWQKTAVFFPTLFFLGYMVSALWIHLIFDIDSQVWKSWVSAFPVGRGLLLLGIAPLLPMFLACRTLCSEMTAEEAHWRKK
ncbi:MAG: hypothetical protein KKE44_05985 [Proteobacteria bacterium]|nr:hypothetical protein [Pseudomonadota bacterium]MBU1582278.1 hypothetical protein [Pseudomonadota bacterium]MBU2452051.1 hypothetical protein [Pseudomonadota bacterium]MBU2627668.1 hypothetical protein [Pseudomonadota bacterium]